MLEKGNFSKPNNYFLKLSIDLLAIDSIAQCKLNIHRSSYEKAAFNRNRQDVYSLGRAVKIKVKDLKSFGIFPRRFEYCRLRKQRN